VRITSADPVTRLEVLELAPDRMLAVTEVDDFSGQNQFPSLAFPDQVGISMKLAASLM
jgi:hypothetical protein